MNKVLNFKMFLPIVFFGLGFFASSCNEFPMPGGRGRNIRPIVSAMSLTKGATTTTESLTDFMMIAVTGDYIDHTISETVKQTPTNGIYFTAIAKRSGTGSSASWSTYDSSGSSAKEYYWINDNPMVFWSWAPYNLSTSTTGILAVTSTPNIPTTTSTNHDKLTFTYTMPTPVSTTSKTDATTQPDLVFAGNVESRTFKDGTDDITAATSNGSTHAKDNNLEIKFYHPLSKVIFGVNVTDGTFHTGLKIKNIEIIDVYSSGTCTFTIPSTFSWASLSTKKTYSQDYGADFSSCTGATNAPAGWPYNSSNGLNICSNAFFLIPQSTSGISVKITFEFEGTTIYKTVALPTTDTWAANKYYLYKIKATGSLDGVSLALTLADWAERGYSILL